MSPITCLSLIAGGATTLGAAGIANANAITADEARSIVAEMLADAESRSSLLQGSAAGHDGKFFLASADGAFRLNIGGYSQFRYVANFSDSAADDGDDTELGFEFARNRIIFSGNVYDNIDFYLQGGFSSDGGGFSVLDSWGRYTFENGIAIRFGQFKAPFLREELVSDSRQLAAERSVTNEIFSQDRSQGIELSGNDESWRWAVMFSDGFGSRNTRFAGDSVTSPAIDPNTGDVILVTTRTGRGLGSESQYALTGRAEFKFSGEWDSFKDFTSAAGQEAGSMLGVAAHFEGGDDTAGEDYTFAAWTADFSYESDGWHIFAAGMGRYFDPGDGEDRTDWGFVAQGGYLLPESNNEIFARYDVVFPDDVSESDDPFNTITVGWNHYVHGHAAKLTVDVQWFIDNPQDTDLVGGGDFRNVGLLANDADSDQLALRAQFQLMF